MEKVEVSVETIQNDAMIGFLIVIKLYVLVSKASMFVEIFKIINFKFLWWFLFNNVHI